MAKTFEEIWAELKATPETTEGKDNNNVIPSFMSNYDKEEGAKEDLLESEKIRQHAGEIAPEEIGKVETPETPKTYNETYHNVLSNLSNQKRRELGISPFDWEANMKLAAQEMSMGGTFAKAKRITNAMMSDVSSKDVTDVFENMVANVKKDKRMQMIGNAYIAMSGEIPEEIDDKINTEYLIAPLRKKDAEGNTYYDFNGHKLYGDDVVSSIANEYVAAHNHRIDMRDPEYREAWSQKTYGKSYDEVITDKSNELKGYLAKAKELYSEYARPIFDNYAHSGAQLLDIPVTTTEMRIATEIQKVEDAINNFEKDGFFSGMRAGAIDAIEMATGSLNGAMSLLENADAVDKAIKGEELDAKDKVYLSLFETKQKLNQMKDEFNRGSAWSEIGTGFTTAIGFMGALGAQSLVTKGASISKELAEQTIKEAFDQSVKQGFKKGLVYAGDTAWKTALTNMPATNYAQRRMDQFSLVDGVLRKEETNPIADMYRAYASAYGEMFFEAAGGLVDDGFAFAGRKLAQIELVDKALNSKVVNRVKDFSVVQGTKEILVNGLKINSLPGEYIEERLNAYFEPLITGDYFTTLTEEGYIPAFNKHYADVFSSKNALVTLATCGGVSSIGSITRSASGIMNAVEINKLRKEVKEALGGIRNEELKNKLYAAMCSDKPDFSEIANLKWGVDEEGNGIDIADAQRAAKVIFNSANVAVRRGEMQEAERIKVFAPFAISVINKAYLGVDMANPTPTTELVEAYRVGKDGKPIERLGNVIYGDLDSTSGILKVVDSKGVMHDVTMGQGVAFKRTELGDFIAEQYALMFGKHITKERLAEVIENMREAPNMSDETYDKIVEENGFGVHKKGEIVTLTDGRQGVVQGKASGGRYIVEVEGANGKKQALMVGFENILHDTDLEMAAAQAEAQAEGSIAAPEALPTTKDGKVSLDGINDAETLSIVATSEFGSRQAAAEVIDSEIARLQSEQGKQAKQTGLDSVAENAQRQKDTADRIKVLQDARKRLGVAEKAQPKTAEEVSAEREAKQKELDGMSTFDFSRDYRSRMANTQIARNSLTSFINNIVEKLKKADADVEKIDAQIAEAETALDYAYRRATSEADMERITAEQKDAIANLETLKAKKAEMEAERKKMEHRKAQYEQTLKDMGGNTDTQYQEGTIGAREDVRKFAEKASKALGIPVVVSAEKFTSHKQNGMHEVDKDGKRTIYINPDSTTAEQGVGILAHEIGHEFKKVLTPEEWAKFEELVLTARFGQDWQNSEEYKKELDDIQNAEKRVNKRGISDTKAREEVVTYALQTFIFDGERGARAFEAIINQNLNWRGKLMEVWRKVVDKLKSLFDVENPTEQDLTVQSAIEEFGNIFKRYAESEKINKVGDAEKKAVENANATNEVSSSLALADILESKSEAYHQQNATNVPAKTLVQANSDIKAMVDIMRPYVDVEMYGAPVLPKEVYGKGLSTIFKNQSYGASMENTTICLRTLAYIEFVDDVKEKLGRPLTTEESFLASQMLYDIATDPQCLYCYVSLDRKAYDESFLSYLKQRDDVLKMYDAIEGRKTKKAIEEVYQTFLGGRKDTPQMKARFNMWIDAHKRGLPMITAEDLRNTKSIEVAEQSGDANIVKQMADAKKYAQSASWAKKIEDYRAYTGELLKISDNMYQRLNNAYGLRFYSFSEYSPAFIVENMQMMRDAALKGLRGLAYTKEIEFAKIFAPTNANINISIFGRRDADGNMVADTRQGADWVEAQALREQYPNVGLVFVATNDADVEWALAQDFIDVVIPFHIVRTGSNIADFYEWTNYKDMQEDKGGKSILPNEHNNDKETFLRLAEERGLTPRFSKWVENPDYMKLVNETRRASKDTPFLQPIFNLEEAKASFKAFVDKGGYFGGWYNVDEQGYQDGVEQVYQDIVAGKTAKDVDYGRQDVPADALNTKRKVRQHNNVVLRSSNSLQKQPNTQEVVSEADVVEESFSISRDKAEFDVVRDFAVENVGIVMPNLAEKNVKVVGYDGEERTPLDIDREDLKDWAKENVATKDSYIIDSNGVQHPCPITSTAIDKYIDGSSIEKSANEVVHKLALPLLPKILANSIEVEIHPDYNKVDEVRKPENGYNDRILMHRFYGAVEIDGVVYRAKSTIKEFKDKNTALKPYNYEITKIELLSPNSEYANNGTSKPSGTITDSISATKLLQNVEKSYDLGKKVLEESAIDSFSIDRSQYLEGIKDEEYRDWTRGKLYQIEEAVKNGLDVRLGQTISTYDKYAKKEERKAKRAKTDWDRNNAEQKVASYRAITEYGRAMMKEYFPEFIANAHADNIKSGNATLSYIEELFNKYNKNEDTAELFKVVMKTARQIGTKARFETLRDGSRLGEQRANLIKYDVDAMNSDTISDESKARTLLHELIHAVTESGILLVEQPSLMIRTGVTPSAQLTSAVRRLKRTFDSIKRDEAFKGTYGSTSYEEMLAELANPKFAEKLKAHDIWVRVVNGIREVVLAIASIVTGNNYKTSAYTELRDTLTEIIEETPMEFVGFINVVRDETIAKNYMEAESAEEITEPRIEQESYSILREEDTDTIFATAKEEFASTNDWLKTGWLMPDGTQLDFAEGGDYRGTDHRAIGQAYKGVAEHQWQYLQDFESRGGIRIHMNRDGKYGTIEMTIKPTAEQKKRLRSFIGAVGGNVGVDFMDENYNTAHSASYESVSPARVLSGITNFYDEGIKPKGNVQESYSLVGVRGAANIDAMEEATTRLDNLAVAREMESLGKDAKEIRIATGWERGVDGKWRYEMEDMFPDDIEERIKDAVKEGNKGVDLMQIIGYKHPVTVYHTPYKYKVVAFNDPNSRRWGYADSDNEVVGINVASPSENWRSIFAHELQHLIQVEEGFAIGTGTLSRSGASQEARQRYWMIESGLYDLYKLNEDAERVVYRDELLNAMHRGEYPFGGIDAYTIHFVDWLKKQETEIPIDVLQDGFQESKARAILDAYNRASGEVEARNVQTRLNYNDEQRRTTLLSETADVASEDQIIIFEGIKGAGVAEMGSRVTKRMADIAKQLEGKKLTPAQQAVADVYMGKADNKAITFTAADGTVAKVVMRQGNEANAGTKHSIFRHYDTSIGYFAADDILLIPEIIARGERTSNQRGDKMLASYKLDINGAVYTVLTEVKKGKEIFNDFYSNKKASISGTSNTQSAHTDNTNAFSADKDTTTNPKNQISEQESYSLNRDDATIATPELEAEANEELSKEAKLIAELDEAQNAYDRLVRKLKAVQGRKDLTFDEVKAFLLDESVMEGLQEASAGQYKRIIRNVLNVLEKTPNKRIKIESLADRIQEELLSARLNIANSALKAAGRDFKKVITKKREGKNTRGEAIAKYVDDTTRKIVEEFVNAIEYAHSYTAENNKTETKWENILLAGRIFTDNTKSIDQVMAELREILVDKYDEVVDGTLSLLEVYKTLRDAAVDVEDIAINQRGNEKDIQEIDAEILTLEELIGVYKSGAKGFGEALRTIKRMGYGTISIAEARVNDLKAMRKELRKEMRTLKSEEANAKNRLVEAVKDMNTAILSVDKEGRVALKEELAKKKEAQGKFKKGIFRSIRSPHYRNVSSENEKQAENLPYAQRRNMTRRGNVLLSDAVETFEFFSRRIDRMSIPNEWLQDGWYYQFILHPTNGVLARSDWRYKTEKALRDELNEEARKRFAPNKKEGKFGMSDLKKLIKEKSGITITTIESRINGIAKDGAEPTTIDLTIGQLLYIRAMVKQQGGINGYLTLGLKADQIEDIVKETEARYQDFCEFDDFIRGENGVLEKIYKIRNEIYRKIYGRDLDHTEGYFPIERMKDAIPKSEDVSDTISSVTIAGGIGSNKKRVRNSAPMNIDVDYFEKLDKHISESIQWCAGAELIEKMNTLLSSGNFKKILKAQGFSKEVVKKTFMRAIGETLGGAEGKNTKAGKVMNTLAKNAVAANVAFNLNSALKQLVSISATLSNEVSPKLWLYFIGNVMPTSDWSDYKKIVAVSSREETSADEVISLPIVRSCYEWAKENVPTFAKRADSETMGFDILEQEGIDKWDKFANKIKKFGMKPNVWMDLLTCSILTKTYYDYQYDRNIERGMTEQEAHDDARMRAADLMNQTQQSSEGAYVSKLQSDRLVGAEAFWRMAGVAYQNSQLGFDRNARAAYQNIATMLYDMYGEKGAYDTIIGYQAEQYVNRGIDKDKATKMAKADYRRSFITQINTLIHNMLINNILWAASSVMTTYAAQFASAIVLAFVGGSGYDDEPTEISFDRIKEDVKKQLGKSWWVYAIPMSQSIVGKPIADLAGQANAFFKAQHPATMQPFFDTASAISKYFTLLENDESEDKIKVQKGAVALITVDAVSRYGFGMSARTIMRMVQGLYGVATDGETENFMNILSSPRYLTKELAGRPRKGETMEQYTERVGGMYKVINGLNKGEDVSKLRKQYIDQMDAIMLHDTDIDYEKMKEDGKRVNRLSKGLMVSGTYNEGSKSVSISGKANVEEKWDAATVEQRRVEISLAEHKAYINLCDKRLKDLVGWDEDMVKAREYFYKIKEEEIQLFLEEYENYKNIK